MAKHTGMPTKVLDAYTAYLENLLLYNCLAGGVGTPHKQKVWYSTGLPVLHDGGGAHHETLDLADENDRSSVRRSGC